MPERKIFIPWIILIILVMGGFGIFYLARSRTAKEQPKVVTETPTTDTTTTGDNLATVDPTSVDSQFKENLDLATSKALKWRPDAALVYVQVKLTSLTTLEGMETYVFDSPGVADYHFTITISQKSKNFIRATIPTEDYLGSGLLPIDLQYWKLNYVSALQIAEKEGGKDFRDKNLDWTIELNLKRGEPKNWLYWIVDYKTKEGNSLSVKINPFSGEVVKEVNP